MSYNPMFGVGECTAQWKAFQVLWLQCRRIDPAYRGEKFSDFYHRVILEQSLVVTGDGRLTIGMRDTQGIKPDPRFKAAGFLDLRRDSEDLYTWGRRMEDEYPWQEFLDCIAPQDREYVMNEINRQRTGKSGTLLPSPSF